MNWRGMLLVLIKEKKKRKVEFQADERGEEGQGVNEIMGIKKEHKSGDIIIILTQIYVGEQRGEV